MGSLVAGFILWLILLSYSSSTLMWLWHWFIVPFGLPAITIPWALGIMSVVTLLSSTTPSDEKTDMLKLFLTSFCSITLALFVGFAASKFM